jgi:hypothetical protein
MQQEQEVAKPLVDEYELGDTAFEPAIDLPVEPKKEEAPPPTATVETPPEEEAPDTPRTPERGPDGKFLKKPHPAFLLRHATELGLTEEEAAEYTASDLKDFIQMERLRLQDEARALRQPPKQAEQPPVEVPEAVEEEEEDWSDIDSDVAQALKKILAKRDKTIEDLRAKVDALTGLEQQRQNETRNQKIDRLFSELGPAYESLFGKGTRDDFKPDSAEMRRRLAVLAEVERDKGAGSFDAKFRKAAELLFGEREAPATPAEEQPMAERWRSGGLVRPTQRKTGEPKGDKAAMKAAARVLQEQGYMDEDAAILNGLPD